MKTGHCLFLSLLLTAPAGAIADTDYAQANQTDNPYAQYDPDGVPLEITQGKKRHTPTPAEIEALQKQQEQIAYERNWLLHGYEEQLRLRAAKDSGKTTDTDTGSNLYYQLSLNKDLAKLARIPDANAGTSDVDLLLKMSASRTGTRPTSSHPDTSTEKKPEPLSISNYKPLITPLSEVDSAGRSLFSSSFNSPLGQDKNMNTQAPAPTTKPDSTLDSIDLQTPGMVAAKGDGLSDPNLTDLTIDTLPGETIEEARARAAAANQEAQLAVPMNADELHKQQAAAMSPITFKKTDEPPVVQPVPLPPNDEPMPVTKIQPINPVRAPIRDPYDILNH